MKELWRRWHRLWGESKIRLEAAPLHVDMVHAGDRLQVGCRLWHVERQSGLTLEVVATQGQDVRRARLQFDPAHADLPWVLREEDGATRLASRDLMHFPVAVTHWALILRG